MPSLVCDASWWSKLDSLPSAHKHSLWVTLYQCGPTNITIVAMKTRTIPPTEVSGSSSMEGKRSPSLPNVFFDSRPLPPRPAQPPSGHPIVHQISWSKSAFGPSPLPVGPHSRSFTIDQPSSSKTQSKSSPPLMGTPPKRSMTHDPPPSLAFLTSALQPLLSHTFPPTATHQRLSSSDSSSAGSLLGATDVWESREGEELLIEAQFVQCRCFGPRRQDPERMPQCDCRIFELANEVCGLPTKRIALRSCQDEGHSVSYCKSRWTFNIRKIKFRLNDTAQGCL